MNGSKSPRLTPEEEAVARALLEKDLEGMMAMIFLQRRETDNELLRKMNDLSEKMDMLSEKVENLTPRVSATENRLKEVNFWLQQIHDSARDAKTRQAPDPEKKGRSKLSGSSRQPRRSTASGKGSEISRDPLPEPHILLRQKTEESLAEMVREQTERRKQKEKK